MEMPIDYHLIFMIMSFIIFIISLFLLFIETTLEKTVAANILIMFNIILCIIVSLSFGAIDMYGYDSTGAVVHNVYSELYPFIYLYWVLGYVNIMLLFYCAYHYYKKPWEQYEKDRHKYFGNDYER